MGPKSSPRRGRHTKCGRPRIASFYGAGYGGIHGDIVALLEATGRADDCHYWEIGHRIVEFEQSRQDRAGYGKALLKRRSTDLSRRFRRGFSEDSLKPA
ncbi:DUF1016 family protein (plasmid) [Cupriavidus necator]|uniref:DUF1016 family protein n=1 Tax=Cupriavidus necator TaxID=106590 RepID=A0A367P6S6_CUPNE|nr:DUF1016 family protein [Cupriavidus necator]RCJ03548.1 DUF1016 family protein [Cupriavidus necator]